jgi:Fic family protein
MNIKKSPSGTIVPVTGGQAFIPHPLPPDFPWTEDLANSLSRADFLLGRLTQEGVILPDPYVFVRPFAAREAVLSSKIEGTRTTFEEMLTNEAGASIDRHDDEIQEVDNYINALSFGIDRLKQLPLSLRLIKELHEILMQGARGKHAAPGEFRRVQNWIGIPGGTLATAKFVPPPPHELMKTLHDLELFLHDRTLPPLIHIALCHYQFEAIHPFLDGNGRVGRLLIILLMIERHLLTAPLLYISAFFESTRDEYYRQLYNVSAQGAWHDWIIYFLHGVATQADDALMRIERIKNLIKMWQEQAAGQSPLVHTVITHLAANPFVTTNKIAQDHAVAFTTAQRAIGKLEALGILEQKGEKERNRLYYAPKLFAIWNE